MNRTEFLAKVEAVGHVSLIENQGARVVALARKHRGGPLLDDLQRNVATGMSFGQWLVCAEQEFPVNSEDVAGTLLDFLINKYTNKKEGQK